MDYVFGPVPSKRLGKSLGIDTIPLKTCNWNCIYCQLGRTVPLTNVRRHFFSSKIILEEVAEALASHKSGAIDWITFVGSGEPTLNANLGGLIRKVKKLSEYPVAVISNGSLLYLSEIRSELSAADAVLPSLDAGSASLYRKINRPYPEVTFERLVDGLIEFRKEYDGNLWIEVMLVQGLNDTDAALRDISGVLQLVCPDEVHINIPSRPPVESWVKPPDEEVLRRAKVILGEVARIVSPSKGEFFLGDEHNIVDDVIGVITRHPMRHENLVQALTKVVPGDVEQVLSELESSQRAQVVVRNGIRYWSAKPSIYPGEDQSMHTAPKRIRDLDSSQGRRSGDANINPGDGQAHTG